MKWIRHDVGLFAAVAPFLMVGCPCIEDVSGVWEEITPVFGLGAF